MYNIPIYEARILDQDDFGISAVALVQDPAVEVNFQYFNKEEDAEKFKFSVQDVEQKIIFGCIIRADYPIFRLSSDGMPYYIRFSADTIKLMAQKYLRENRQNNIKLTHSEGTDTDDVEMLECFIKDTSRGINPVGFEDVADGSLFGAFKVLNDNIWAQIKDGTFAGFSIEVNMSIELPEYNYNRQVNKMKNTKLTRLKEAIKNILIQFEDERITSDKGIITVMKNGDEIAIGDVVMGVDEDGNEVQIENGEYILTDGTILNINEGKIDEIVEPELEQPKEDAPVEEEVIEEPVEEVVEVPAESEEVIAAEEIAEEAEDAVKEAEEIVEEVKEAEVDAKDEEISALKGVIEAKDVEIEALKAEIDALKNEPAAESATEEFAKVNSIRKTGNERLDNLLRFVK